MNKSWGYAFKDTLCCLHKVFGEVEFNEKWSSLFYHSNKVRWNIRRRLILAVDGKASSADNFGLQLNVEVI